MVGNPQNKPCIASNRRESQIGDRNESALHQEMKAWILYIIIYYINFTFKIKEKFKTCLVSTSQKLTILLLEVFVLFQRLKLRKHFSFWRFFSALILIYHTLGDFSFIVKLSGGSGGARVLFWHQVGS